MRGHAAWALGKLGSPEALMALGARATVDSDGGVLEELESALNPTGADRPARSTAIAQLPKYLVPYRCTSTV